MLRAYIAGLLVSTHLRPYSPVLGRLCRSEVPAAQESRRTTVSKLRMEMQSFEEMVATRS